MTHAGKLAAWVVTVNLARLAFPKTAKGVDLTTEAPGVAEPKQLRDLHIELKVKQPTTVPASAPKA